MQNLTLLEWIEIRRQDPEFYNQFVDAKEEAELRLLFDDDNNSPETGIACLDMIERWRQEGTLKMTFCHELIGGLLAKAMMILRPIADNRIIN